MGHCHFLIKKLRKHVVVPNRVFREGERKLLSIMSFGNTLIRVYFSFQQAEQLTMNSESLCEFQLCLTIS